MYFRGILSGICIPVLWLLFFIGHDGYSQSSFMVRHYSKQEYHAGSQNWSVDSDQDGYLYFGNNEGLIVFDGTHWKTYRNPGQTIVRSVYAASDRRIYTGSYEEFGYWQRENDSLVYHSLKSFLKNTGFHNSEIWKIVESNGKIYFQSFSSLFVYDYKTVRAIELPGSVIFLLKARNRLFIQSVPGEFFEIVHDKVQRIGDQEILKGKEVKTILPFGKNSFLIGTTAHGLFLFDGIREIRPFITDVDVLLKQYQINNGIVHNGRIVLGTIVNGIVILDSNGRLTEHLNSGNSLQNNTVLSICAAPDGTIWAGLDRGIDNLSYQDKVTIYQEKSQDMGAVYSAALSGNLLYIGTNRGIFMYFMDTLTGKFRYSGFVDDSQGQVWEIKAINGQIFCGHTTGTYILHGAGMQKISDASGGFSLKEFKYNGGNYLIQSTYSPLVLYRQTGETWKYEHQVSGFQEPARFIEPDHLGNIWVGHVVKGLYRLRLSKNLDSVSNVWLMGQKDGFPADFNLRVFKVGNRVIFTTGSILFTWDDLKNRIIPYEELNRHLNGFEAASQIVNAGNDKYWFVRKTDLALFEIREGVIRQVFSMFLPLYGLNMVDGYENVVPLDRNRTLLCLDNGFAIIGADIYNQEHTDSTHLVFRDLYLVDPEGRIRNIHYEKSPLVISHSWNTISISFTAANSKFPIKLYQYKLQGIDKEWSNWTADGEVTYSRLPSGTFRFLVRTFTGSGLVSSPIVLNFKVKPAWYASLTAYLFYFLALAGITFLSRYLFRRRVLRHHERLRRESEAKALMEKQQADREIIQLQNDKLQSEISYKNIQLADQTMAIIRKNELLIEIKEEVSRQKEATGQKNAERSYDRLLSLINKNISSDADWQVFEELFDQAHQNFFKRLKSAFPDLTQSDLKLCAYLRLNLTSKEIAPLLNITFRGVETRRYRLRRRMALESDFNLVEFIMQF